MRKIKDITGRASAWFWSKAKPGRIFVNRVRNFFRFCRGLDPVPLDPQVSQRPRSTTPND